MQRGTNKCIQDVGIQEKGHDSQERREEGRPESNAWFLFLHLLE
jgi:hypothetical protein